MKAQSKFLDLFRLISKDTRWMVTVISWDALRNLVQFWQFKKREKHPFSKIGCFSRFLNYAYATKSRKTSDLISFTFVYC